MVGGVMDYERLKERQRAERHGYPENLGLRVHRALSWLHRAEQLANAGDVDGEFIFLWIAFNAAYATDIEEKYRESEQQTFRGFLEKLTELDKARKRFDAFHAAKVALGRQDTVTVLSIVLSRIYVLRNQLVHGGATWDSSVNREQLRDCTNFMAKLAPLVIEVMMDHPQTLWGQGTYPVVT